MGKMTPYEAWQIVSKMVDQTYTNQDFAEAVHADMMAGFEKMKARNDKNG